MINENIAALGYNEDGDQDCRLTVVCDTIQDAREATVYLKERYGLHNVTWEGKGGKLVYTRNYSVCGASFAIEQRNDRWASAQSEMEYRY
jgi:hypothetical protein